ncbi:hypothetical protein PQC07_gp010 [Aeromonas phage D3]|uniref:Uncharacterized protein n=3 Tax=Ludhianavirus TaxID=3044751 RepID=A0A514A1I3_9CAUD|nr:hypothetical protein PQC06_gp172 [Aeromonas phage LAh10]YP_010668746.1 hypothetical protein PQC07_gp010 [Aeromonas phage D3]YP_010669013.1 hypothetical protein PQC08_gp010 [Aeromonas phage D6]QEP52301.1 hypothetical protein D9_0094 [Aeromonas phage D9]QDH47096.1 hypothetical protein LAh10_172 [Aeromonas phage LAh10]QDJ96995.1 hypothetical protein D3_0265 [Aeromonas phage D3]QDJ97424.1 hypothetical protein D6_0265 [Aeromonas phage D6]
MILNGYDTTVGTRFKVKDKVTETLRALQSSDRLELVENRGVYAITHKNDFGLPPFIFPMSIQNYMRKPVTVFDQRGYINREGRNINIPEYNVMLLAACLQQDLQLGNKTLIKSVRPFTVKAFANAMGRKLERTVAMDMTQKRILRTILAYYYVCLMEDPNVDYKFIAQNVIKAALRYDINDVREVIDELGYVGTLPDLLSAIVNHPSLFALKNLDMAGLVGVAGTIFFSTSGFKFIVSAAIELPTLFTAMCWGAASQRIYQNTTLGEELNVKQDKNVETFIKQVGYYFQSV